MSPEFSDNERAFIRQVAFEVGEVIAARLIKDHMATCKIGQNVRRLWWLMVGIGVGLGATMPETLPKLVTLLKTIGG
ncbi:hypothetical protein IMZ48_23925 [Candidatus Bathyarchaeota archaeon]|nr:hypothetical protein [Candidatus Bathyarchaeota archaeon]